MYKIVLWLNFGIIFSISTAINFGSVWVIVFIHIGTVNGRNGTNISLNSKWVSFEFNLRSLKIKIFVIEFLTNIYWL